VSTFHPARIAQQFAQQIAQQIAQPIARPLAPPGDLNRLLSGLFPELNTAAVQWYGTLPWFMAPFKWVSGITLPDALSRHKVCIYLRQWEPSDPEWVALAVHEAYHALQIQEAARQYGWQLGTWHPFLWHYLASWMKHGYRRHPLEMPAFAFEADFRDAFEERENPDAWEDSEQLAVLASPVPKRLVRRQAGYTYRDPAWLLLPAALLLVPAGVVRTLGEGLLRLWPGR
jgi:hypothetical protein